MTPYYEYCEWPATQRLRPTWLARRVKIFQRPRPEKALAHGDNPKPVQAAACRIMLSDIVAISSTLKNFHEMFGLAPGRTRLPRAAVTAWKGPCTLGLTGRPVSDIEFCIQNSAFNLERDLWLVPPLVDRQVMRPPMRPRDAPS
jgi:hypothetical protein